MTPAAEQVPIEWCPRQLRILIVVQGRGYPYAIGGAEIFAYRFAQVISQYTEIEKVLLIQGGNNAERRPVAVKRNKLEIVYIPLYWYAGINRTLLNAYYMRIISKFKPNAILGIALNSAFSIIPFVSHKSGIAFRFAGLDICLLNLLSKGLNKDEKNTLLEKYCEQAEVYLANSKNNIYIRLLRYILKMCEIRQNCIFIVLSRTMRELSKKLGRTFYEKTVIIPNFVDGNFFEIARKRFREKQDISKRNKRSRISIIYVGRLEYEKGADILALIASKILNKCRLCSLKIVGDGSYRRLFERLKKIYGSRIIVTGFVPYTAVPRHLIDADIFLFPTRIEGSPNALLQAMAAGLAIVASDIPSNREFLGDAGLYAPLNNPDLFVDRLLLLINDMELRMKLGWRAHLRARVYSINNIARLYLSVFRALVS